MAHAARLGIARIEHPELDRPEVHLPAVIVDLLEPDQFSREAVRQIPLGRAKGNNAVGIRALHPKMRRILRGRQLTWIRAGRRRVARRGRVIGQRLMRPVVIVFAAKAVERALLRTKARARRPRRLGLQGAVHPFVAPVLVGTSGENALRTDAETNPPDGQPG